MRREFPAAVEAMPGGHPRLDEFAAAIEARCRAVARDLAHVEEAHAGEAGPEPPESP